MPLNDATYSPRWTMRRVSGSDRESVLSLFTEPEFYFRTAVPDTRPEWEVMALVGDDSRLLLGDGEPVGLAALETVGSDHACHYELHLRLRATAPDSWWQSAYHEIVRSHRWRHEVGRITMRVNEFDNRGLAIARAVGMTEEGTLASVVFHDGRRYGTVYFSHVWIAE